MSWGTKIAILYLSFVALIVSLVSMSMKQRVDLEANDYYAQELKYQDKINKMNRTNELGHPLSWQVKNNRLVIEFPSDLKGSIFSGSVYLLRPSDASLDCTIPIAADTSGLREISLEKLKAGLYKLQISWKSGETEYYNEGVITVK